jgi:transcriptional regulator GlxA family with amidase domain
MTNDLPRTVVFVLTPGLHLLDLAGPAQVFSASGDHGGAYRLAYVADTAQVRAHQGVDLSAQTSWPALSPRDYVLVPGWRVQPGRPAGRALSPLLRDGLLAHHAAGGQVASVCAGAFALAAAGLLDGRRATTHHDVQDELARKHPRVEVVRDVLHVSDGRVHTSAGVASGIDLALHLLAVDHGPAAAARTARSLVLAARRNGTQPQESAMLRHRDHLADLVHRAQDLIDARYAESLALPTLASSLGVSPRTLTRSFTAATGLTPLKYQQTLRLERAEALAQQGWTQDAIARTVGFSDARMLRRLRAGA